MPRILIVADDYTGANDTAVLMAERGIPAYTVLTEADDDIPDAACIAVSTDSRAQSPQAAYRSVFETTRRYMRGDPLLFSKRIDSTLRGNLGAEIDAMLDAVGEKRYALVVPAFPGAGRIYKDRCLYVNGVRLEETAAAKDPRNPVHTSSALKLIQEQSRYPAGEISIGDLRQGMEAVQHRIKNLRANGARLIVCEAETEEDLQLLAVSAVNIGEPFICADPGAFSCALARFYQTANRGFKVFFLVGSVNAVTASQMLRLSREKDVQIVYLDLPTLLEEGKGGAPDFLMNGLSSETAEKTGRTLEEMLAAAPQRVQTVCLCTSGIFPENQIDFSRYGIKTGIGRIEISERLNRLMADLASKVILRHPEIRGVAACGGDTAVALCRSLGAKGEYPLEEVIPLTVYGKLAGGEKDGLPMITKGGMIGGEDTLIRCRDYLYHQILKGEPS